MYSRGGVPPTLLRYEFLICLEGMVKPVSIKIFPPPLPHPLAQIASLWLASVLGPLISLTTWRLLQVYHQMGTYVGSSPSKA